MSLKDSGEKFPGLSRNGLLVSLHVSFTVKVHLQGYIHLFSVSRACIVIFWRLWTLITLIYLELETKVVVEFAMLWIFFSNITNPVSGTSKVVVTCFYCRSFASLFVLTGCIVLHKRTHWSIDTLHQLTKCCSTTKNFSFILTCDDRTGNHGQLSTTFDVIFCSLYIFVLRISCKFLYAVTSFKYTKYKSYLK